MKCQLGKIYLESGYIESEWKDSARVTMFTISHVLDHAIFTQVRLAAIWEDSYLHLMRSLNTVITNAQGANPLAIEM